MRGFHAKAPGRKGKQVLSLSASLLTKKYHIRAKTIKENAILALLHTHPEQDLNCYNRLMNDKSKPVSKKN